jgi:hypothetical protein
MNAATIAIRQTMTTDSPPPPLFDDNFHPPDADTAHAYAIDTLFDPSYQTTDTEEIETKEALLAPDREKFIAAIRLEVDSLINVTKTLIPIQKDSTGNFPTHQHPQQARMEDPHHPEVQAQEARQRRTRQAQGKSRRERGHAPPHHG